MSKLALINRNEKRKKLVAKYAKRRVALVAIVENAKASEDDRYAARLKLQQLPRNANPTRVRNRCGSTRACPMRAPTRCASARRPRGARAPATA